jgi:hypothetical protein
VAWNIRNYRYVGDVSAGYWDVGADSVGYCLGYSWAMVACCGKFFFPFPYDVLFSVLLFVV